MTSAATDMKVGVDEYRILGLRIDTLDPQTTVERVTAMAAAGAQGYCCVSNVYQCILGHDDPTFGAVLDGATFNVTDSRVLHRLIARKYNLPNVPTLYGPDLMLQLCGSAAAAGLPVALVGGRDEVALGTLAERLCSAHPTLDISYAFSPPFAGMDAAAEVRMIDELRASGARLVFVGLGCPKQERWMARHSSQITATMIGVGGAFDFNAGTVRRSPPWVHAAGLEWAWRLSAEPKRLWRRYLIESPRFLYALWREERLAEH